MKKILLISLLIIGSINSYSKVIIRPARVSVSRPSVRTVSKPSVVRVKPSTKIITHKAAIKPNTIKPIKTSSNKTSTLTSNYKHKISSNFNNTSTKYNKIISSNNNGNSFLNYMLISKMINNNKTNTSKDMSNINISELIKFLKNEIEEEENKIYPDKEKIKKYKEYINLLQNKK